jgi:putative transposase
MELGKAKLFQDIYTVKLLDSTIVDVAARLIGVMASKPSRRFERGKTNKGQIKIKAVFNWCGRLPEIIQLKKGLNGELSAIKGWVRKAVKGAKEAILVFDLGFLSYQFIHWLIKEKVYFVSRIKSNTRYEIIKKLGWNDWLVKIGITAEYQKTSLVRLVRVKEKKRWYYYITNLMDSRRIKRKDIRLLYRYRWQIEIFFKELKHTLNIKKLFFYNPNGIKGQIYISLRE